MITSGFVALMTVVFGTLYGLQGISYNNFGAISGLAIEGLLPLGMLIVYLLGNSTVYVLVQQDCASPAKAGGLKCPYTVSLSGVFATGTIVILAWAVAVVSMAMYKLFVRFQRREMSAGIGAKGGKATAP